MLLYYLSYDLTLSCLNSVLLRYLLFILNCDDSRNLNLLSNEIKSLITSRHIYIQVKRAYYIHHDMATFENRGTWHK